MLVDHLAAERSAEVDRLATLDHRVGERERLGRRETTEEDGHAERGHLVVGHLATRVAEHDGRDLGRRQLFAVALAMDQLGGADHVVATKIVLRPCTTKGNSTSSGTSLAGTDTESR